MIQFPYLKEVFAKNGTYVEKYSMVLRRKLLKTTHTEERSVHTIQKIARFNSDRNKINLISNKSFRYYKQ